MNKKSQITIFIILGIAILLIGGIVLYAITQKIEVEPEEKLLSDAPRKVKIIVDSCINSITLEGLEIIRLQGGYIDIPQDKPILQVINKEENKVVVNKDGHKKIAIDNKANTVPYWLTENDLVFPSKNFVESQLADYISKELRYCVDNFNSLKQEGISVEQGNINTDVEFGESVVTKVNYTLKIYTKNNQYILDKFISIIPVNMQLLYNMALYLTSYEFLYTFLEDDTKNLINLYSGLSKNKLPPITKTDVNINCDYITWSEDSVEKNLKEIISRNFKYIKISNTNFNRVISSNPISQGTYDSFIEEIPSNIKFPNINIEFIFDKDFGFDKFDIKPYTGPGIAPPDKVSEANIPFLPSFCTFKYSYKYDLQFPVLIKIKDTNSQKIDPITKRLLPEKGFTFQFPLIVSICGNQNRQCTGKPLYAYVGYNLNETSLNISTDKSYFCDLSQRQSGNVIIETFDSETNKPLPDVNVYYYCGSYQNNCFVGQTDSNGLLQTKFPLCYNGLIYLTLPDYNKLVEGLTINSKENRELKYYLEKNKELIVEINVIDAPIFIATYFSSDTFEQPIITGLSPQEKAIISMEGDKRISYIYPSQNNKKIAISSGNYKINIQLIGNITISPSTYNINGEEITISYNPLGGEDYKGYWILGKTQDINWKISKDDLKDKYKVTFYVLAENRWSNNLEVEDLLNPIILNNGSLRMKGYPDILPEQYLPYLKPKLS